MAIQLKLDYSKKLGLPQYSSHQFSVSLTSEVNDVAQIHAEVERIYEEAISYTETALGGSGLYESKSDRNQLLRGTP